MTNKKDTKRKLESICGTAKEREQLSITNCNFYIDGYAPAISSDGYHHTFQINIKLTDEDMRHIININQKFFDNEITNSTLSRILLRKGIKYFKDIK